MLDTIDAVATVLDREGCIIAFKQTCEEITGNTFGEALGHLVWEFLIPSEQIVVVREVLQKLQSGNFTGNYKFKV